MKARPTKKGDFSSSSSESSSLDQEETPCDRSQERAIAAISWAARSHKKGLIHTMKDAQSTGIKCLCGMVFISRSWAVYLRTLKLLGVLSFGTLLRR